MNNLMYKELKLVVAPITYFFVLCAALLIVPSYPYIVGLSYGLIAFMPTFLTAQANNDHKFTAMLPIPRRSIVLSKHFVVAFIETLQLIIAVPFAALSSLVINKGGNTVGIDANFAFFGIVMILYAVFNIIFLPWYFKTGYKTGLPLLFAFVGYLTGYAVIELLINILPFLKRNLDSLDPATFVYQIPLMLIGLAVFVSGLVISYKISVKNFEKVSL